MPNYRLGILQLHVSQVAYPTTPVQALLIYPFTSCLYIYCQYAANLLLLRAFGNIYTCKQFSPKGQLVANVLPNQGRIMVGIQHNEDLKAC